MKSQPSVFTHKAALSTQAVWAPWVQRRPSEVLSVWSHNFESVWSQNLEQLELFVLTAGALAIVFGLRAHVSITTSDPCGLNVDETKPCMYTHFGGY